MITTITTLDISKIMGSIGIQIKTTPELIATLRQGLPFEVFTSLQTSLSLSAEVLAKLIGVPVRTLNRRKNEGRFKPEESDNLVRIARVLARVKDFFTDADTAIKWLKTPELAFDNETPLSLLDTELGAQEILQLLGQLEHGISP